MNQLFKKVKEIRSEGCVSIILNTHRTKPDNQKDAITLKNLIKKTEERLLNDYDKRFASFIIKKLKNLANTINHNFNLESLVLFVNADFAEYTRIPIEVEDRVIIDNTFATRDLVRAMHQATGYYVLVLSRQNARLIEAYNDKVVQEFKGNFPIKNTLYTKDKIKLSTAKGQDNLIEEFFNKVDKLVLKSIKNNPLPIILATEIRNFSHYQKIADKKDLIVGHVSRNRDDEKPYNIILDAWKVVQANVKEKHADRIVELGKAVSLGRYLSDYNEIWNVLQQGRGQTLFVKNDFFQSALLIDNKILLDTNFGNNQKGIVDDIIDEMIELNISFGGDTVFLEGNELEQFQNLALITRY